MLSKIAYRQLLKRIDQIKSHWLEDRKENPNLVPYDAKSNVRAAIERVMREHHVHCGGLAGTEQFINRMIEYLIEKKIIKGHPLGGIMFDLPEGHAPIPSKEEFIAQTTERLKTYPILGKIMKEIEQNES